MNVTVPESLLDQTYRLPLLHRIVVGGGLLFCSWMGLDEFLTTPRPFGQYLWEVPLWMFFVWGGMFMLLYRVRLTSEAIHVSRLNIFGTRIVAWSNVESVQFSSFGSWFQRFCLVSIILTEPARFPRIAIFLPRKLEGFFAELPAN